MKLISKTELYTPNWTDPRNLKRLEKVLTWIRFYTCEEKETKIHHDTLVDIFGPRSSKLGNYLRSQILTQTGVYVVGQSSYSYLIKKNEIEQLNKILKLSQHHTHSIWCTQV